MRPEAKKEYMRQYYQKNKDKWQSYRDPEAHYAQIKGRRQDKRKRLIELKSELGCNRCGLKDGRCLTFHHIDPKQKEFTVTRGIEMGLTWEKILLETEKCEVLCANCHAIEHFENGNGREKNA